MPLTWPAATPDPRQRGQTPRLVGPAEPGAQLSERLAGVLFVELGEAQAVQELARPGARPGSR